MTRETESTVGPTRTVHRRSSRRETENLGVEPVFKDPVILRAGESLARFQVLRKVGAGGMGQVYAAYDPELDRRVAIKLLLTDGDPGQRQRLLREAQALAKLSHPNVVAVHDVGTHGRHLFVAMEFVEGETLLDWAEEHPLPGDTERLITALELLCAVGRGLMAAHQAGLVHRDIKPRNILVGDDGRVRVADFGLARAGDLRPSEDGDVPPTLAPDSETTWAPDDEPEPARQGSGASSGMLAEPMTRTGTVVGTPAYMAPEQFTGDPVDGATDQFGFCVMAWELLFGLRPFLEPNVARLLAAMQEGQPRRADRVEVPPAVESALRKGLAYAPQGRHPSMAALLAILEEEIRRLRGEGRGGARKWVPALVVLGVVGSVVAFQFGRGGRTLCEGGPAKLEGVWDDGRKGQLRDAILGTGADFAQGAWSRLETNVDGWSSGWLQGHRDACEATRVRGEQSSAVMDRRMACLAVSHQALVAYLDVLEEGDVSVLSRADEGFAELPSYDRCADLAHVESQRYLYEDPEDASRAQPLQHELAVAQALLNAGEYGRALELSAPIAEGDDLPRVRSRAALLAGRATMEQMQPRESELHLRRAYALARRDGNAELSAQAARLMAINAAANLYRAQEGRWWIDLARLEGTGLEDPTGEAGLASAESVVLSREGKLREAIARLEAALEVYEGAEVVDRATLNSARRRLGRLYALTGDLPRALSILDQAKKELEAWLGPDHPSLARVHVALARTLRALSRLDEAEAQAVRAIEIQEAVFGPDHVVLFSALQERSNVQWEQNRIEDSLVSIHRARTLSQPQPLSAELRSAMLIQEAQAQLLLGQPREATTLAREALALAEEHLGADHPTTGTRRIELAGILSKLGQGTEARALVREGLEVGEALLGSEDPDLAHVYDLAALVMETVGDLEQALVYRHEAIDILHKVYGRGSMSLLPPNNNLCGLLSKTGHNEEAIAVCTAVLADIERFPGRQEQFRPFAHNNLGAALVAAGRPEEARPHFEKATALWLQEVGEGSMQHSVGLANQAEVALLSGQVSRALTLYEQALRMREQVNGEGSPTLVYPMLGLAEAQLVHGQADRAADTAERALAIVDEHPNDPVERARAHWLLGRARYEQGKRTEGRALVGRALRAYEAQGQRGREKVAEIDAWLAAHE